MRITTIQQIIDLTKDKPKQRIYLAEYRGGHRDVIGYIFVGMHPRHEDIAIFNDDIQYNSFRTFNLKELTNDFLYFTDDVNEAWKQSVIFLEQELSSLRDTLSRGKMFLPPVVETFITLTDYLGYGGELEDNHQLYTRKHKDAPFETIGQLLSLEVKMADEIKEDMVQVKRIGGSFPVYRNQTYIKVNAIVLLSKN